MPDVNEAPKPVQETPTSVLYKAKGAPTPEQVAAWKASTCNQRIRAYSPLLDPTRVWLLRGLNGIEFDECSKLVPENISPEKAPNELAMICASKATVWTTVTASHKEDVTNLRVSGAGLPQALFEIISILSDFASPAHLDAYSEEL